MLRVFQMILKVSAGSSFHASVSKELILVMVIRADRL
jgi:hypothetical protein